MFEMIVLAGTQSLIFLLFFFGLVLNVMWNRVDGDIDVESVVLELNNALWPRQGQCQKLVILSSAL